MADDAQTTILKLRARLDERDKEITELRRQAAQRFQERMVVQDAGPRDVEIVYVPDGDRSEGVRGYFVMVHDVTERVRAQEALRESEERLRLALAAGQMGAWDVDLATGRTCWDAKEFALLGFPDGSVPPSPQAFYQHVHPDDHALIRQAVQRAVERTGDMDYEFRVIRSARWGSGEHEGVGQERIAHGVWHAQEVRPRISFLGWLPPYATSHTLFSAAQDPTAMKKPPAHPNREAMQAAGAVGFVTKESAADQLYEAVIKAVRSLSPSSPPQRGRGEGEGG